MSERTGACLCGQARYRLTADPVSVRICWCRDCQRISSNGTVNAVVPSAAIEITGELSAYNGVAASGNQTRRRFCPRCGTQLFSDSSGRAGLTVVRVGTLDDPSSVKPTTNIWCASAPAWAVIDRSLEYIAQQSPPLPPPAR